MGTAALGVLRNELSLDVRNAPDEKYLAGMFSREKSPLPSEKLLAHILYYNSMLS